MSRRHKRARANKARNRDRSRASASAPTPTLGRLVRNWLLAPQPIERLVVLRILVPLAILGFLSGRLSHADAWLTDRGFQVPNLGVDDYRQPLYLPAIPVWAAWSVAALTVTSALAFVIGWRARLAGALLGACLLYLALADRLASFTVSKLGPILVLALVMTPCGDAYSLDAWLLRRRDPARSPPSHVSGGNVRFFQILLVVFYCASGTCKARGDWLSTTPVIWSHLHDSYQTWIAYQVARALPGGAWLGLQWLVLAFEALAPLWFALAHTRLVALAVGFGMHLFIGLSFGPVLWFALLMIGLLAGCFAPLPWLQRALRVAR